jgi:hypothetical protein
MEVQLKIDDPETYTRPFTLTLKRRLLPDTDLLESFCDENEKDLTHFEGKPSRSVVPSHAPSPRPNLFLCFPANRLPPASHAAAPSSRYSEQESLERPHSARPTRPSP